MIRVPIQFPILDFLVAGNRARFSVILQTIKKCEFYCQFNPNSGLYPMTLSLNTPIYNPTALRVALVVGSVLFVINHGEAVVTDNMTRARWFSALLTYGVPYTVSLHGQAQGRQAQERRIQDYKES
jgi:hypothetical protein